MDNPAIGVIIPAYNGEKYLAEALASVLSQTYRTMEIILVDDGSTDATPRIAKDFGLCVRYVSQSNQGTAVARNRGVDLAIGDLLAFLDQDDLWVADKLARQVEAFQSDPELDIVFGHVAQFCSPDVNEDLKRRLSCSPDPFPGLLPSTMLIQREAFYRVGPFERKWQLGEWSNWYIRAVDLGLKMRMLPDVVARRRLHAGNKGILQRDSLNEYAQILKASLDRRRAGGELQASPSTSAATRGRRP